MPRQAPTTGPLTQEALRRFMDGSATPMLLSDDELRYRDVNEAACRLVGRTREQLLEGKIGDLTPDGDQEQVAARTEAFFRDGSLRGRVTVIGAEGRPVEVEFTSIANVIPGMHLTMALAVETEAGLFLDDDDANPQGTERGPLTPREREVLTALALGRTGVEIAAELHISPDTVRNHVRNARGKLGARTRAHAIIRALQRGEIRA